MIRHIIPILLLVTLAGFTGCGNVERAEPEASSHQEAAQFARYVGKGGQPVYGIVDGENLREISDAPWNDWEKTNRVTPAAKAKFLAVTDAPNVYAMAGNYKDHLVGATPERLEKAKTPQFFM